MHVGGLIPGRRVKAPGYTGMLDGGQVTDEKPTESCSYVVPAFGEHIILSRDEFLSLTESASSDELKTLLAVCMDALGISHGPVDSLGVSDLAIYLKTLTQGYDALAASQDNAIRRLTARIDHATRTAELMETRLDEALARTGH